MKKLLALIALLAQSTAFAQYVGDYAPGTVVCRMFTTYQPSTGAAFALASGAVDVYFDNSDTQDTDDSGLTLTASVDSVVGQNRICADTSADGTFYAAGRLFHVVLQAGTVDSVSVVGSAILEFSLNKESPLRPATAGRALVVDAAGLADANTVKIGPTGSGTAQTARDLGTSVLVSSGTGTGQISLSSGAVLLQPTQSGVTIPTVTSLTNAPSDSSGVTTLLGRLTATRAGYLDNLSAGAVATAAGLAAACPKDVVCTTVATAPTTTTVTLTAAPNTDTQLDEWAILFTNNGDADDYCLRAISSVASGTITYSSACPFTVAAGDVVALLPAFLGSPVAVLTSSVRDIIVEPNGNITLGCALAVGAISYPAGHLVTIGADSTYEDPSGTETRITGNVSSPGNRTASVTCPSY